jgi:EmrB/QacA subfamily drug resistance transporter
MTESGDQGRSSDDRAGTATAIPDTSARAANEALRRPRLLLALVCLTQFMVILDVSIVNVALPSIQTGLHFGTTGLQWVVNAYTITFGGFLLLGGRAADLLGRRRVFLFGTGLFGVSSLLCAFAGSRGLMIGARSLQGLGGAVLSPASLSIIATSFAEGAERNRALGVWGAMAGLGGSSGVLFGGILTQAFGWPAIFVVNAPIAIAVIIAGRRVIPESRREDLRRGFDLAGAILVTLGLVAVVYGIVRSESLGWGSAGVLGSLALGLGLLGAFAVVEGRLAAAPLLPLVVLRLRRLRAANLVIALLYAGVFSMWFFLSLFMQGVLGYSALQAGLAFLPVTLSVALASTIAPRLVARVGACRVIAAGMLSSAVGLALLSGVSPGAGYVAAVLPGGVIAGAGLGMTLVPLTITAVQGVPPAQSGLASGLINTSRLVGGALGLAVLSTLAASHSVSQLAGGSSRAGALTSGYQLAFGAAASICLVGALSTVFLLRPDPSDAVTETRGREARWAAWTCGRIEPAQKSPEATATEPS